MVANFNIIKTSVKNPKMERKEEGREREKGLGFIAGRPGSYSFFFFFSVTLNWTSSTVFFAA